MEVGHRDNLLLDGSLRRMTTVSLKDKAVLPAQLTALARRLLELGRLVFEPAKVGTRHSRTFFHVAEAESLRFTDLIL